MGLDFFKMVLGVSGVSGDEKRNSSLDCNSEFTLSLGALLLTLRGRGESSARLGLLGTTSASELVVSFQTDLGPDSTPSSSVSASVDPEVRPPAAGDGLEVDEVEFESELTPEELPTDFTGLGAHA